MFEKIFFSASLCFVLSHAAMAQHPVTIEFFFGEVFKEKVRFDILLPYKVKIKTQTIKRSNVPSFEVYNLVACKRKRKADASISHSFGAVDYYLNLLKEAGGVVDTSLNNETYLLKFYNNAGDGSCYAIIIKEIKIGSQIHCLSLYIKGKQKILDQELPELLNAFQMSSVSE